MGVLITILMNFLVNVFSKVFLHAAFKIAITLLFITLLVSSIYAYVAAYSTIISALSMTVPDIVAGVFGWVMPANINACLFSIFSAILLRFVTKLYLSILSYKWRATISN